MSKPDPMEDYGIFGPESVAWRVWGYPTSLMVGFQRAVVVVEELEPFLVASVHASQKIVSQARARYDRTICYFATVAFADSASVVRASAQLMKVHSRNVGVEPVSGLRYDANNPDSQPVDPLDGLALGPQGLRGLRAREALARRRAEVLGGVRHRRRVADVQPGRRAPHA